ncbi:MAG: class II aldolase/adducin family protein, partial [Bacteroidales bacterium]|nr:class II aldolase/adducin family protein [Bacteroidales bacterium]
MTGLEQLIDISRKYGSDSRFVIAGGGNTSFKTEDKIWVKASGSSLATITEEGFAVLDRAKLNRMSEKIYSEVAAEREEQVKNDLADATLTKGKRPSVETSMHNAILYPFVIHLHPTLVNGLMCANDAERRLFELFGEKNVYIPYTDPGYVLFKKVEDAIKDYRTRFSEEPKVIWLQNHGIFVAADTTAEVEALYSSIISTLEDAVTVPVPLGDRPFCSCTELLLPGLRMMLSGEGLKTLKVRKNMLIKTLYDSLEEQQSVIRPFTPDAIVYCKSNYLFFNDEEPEAVLAEAEKAIP